MRRDIHQQQAVQKPVTTQTKTYAYCPSSRHDAHKRVATFCDQGLLQFCKLCHAQVLISWSELDEIRLGFLHHQHQAVGHDLLSFVKPGEA